MISRREFAAGVAASAAVGATEAHAAVSCTAYNWQGMQTCTAGLQLGPIVTASQQCQNWCWAACIEAVFAMRGYRVSQRAIVRKIYGGTEPCSRAIGPQIIQAVNGPWIDANNRRFMAYAAPLIDLQFGVLHPQAAALAAQELARNNPLINGAAGHATVMTAMTYVRNNLGQGMPVQIIVRDPWPGNPNRRVLTPREVAGTFFLARVTTS